jgi:hypothetical protein
MTETAEELMAMLKAEAEELKARMPAAPECPPWCELRDRIEITGSLGHAWYDSWTADPLVFSRFHEIGFGGWAVSREETVRDGVVALGPVRVSFHGDDEPMPIERARDLVAGLGAAIIKAEEIEAWSRQHD